jgi:DNA-binding NarL/FixJ family response regulator
VRRGPVRVLVVDDQSTFREAASATIAVTPDFVLAAEATSGEAALALVAQGDVDLVLMDVNMPGIGGVTAARELRRAHPGLAVVLLSTYDPDCLPEEILRSGVRYLHKERFGPAALGRLAHDLLSGQSSDHADSP